MIQAEKEKERDEEEEETGEGDEGEKRIRTTRTRDEGVLSQRKRALTLVVEDLSSSEKTTLFIFC